MILAKFGTSSPPCPFSCAFRALRRHAADIFKFCLQHLAVAHPVAYQHGLEQVPGKQPQEKNRSAPSRRHLPAFGWPLLSSTKTALRFTRFVSIVPLSRTSSPLPEPTCLTSKSTSSTSMSTRKASLKTASTTSSRAEAGHGRAKSWSPYTDAPSATLSESKSLGHGR